MAKSIDIWKNSRLLDFATGPMALGDAMFCRRNTGFLGFFTLAKTIAAIRPSDYESYSNIKGKRATSCFFRRTDERGLGHLRKKIPIVGKRSDYCSGISPG